MSYPKRMDKMIGESINDWTILEARPDKRKGYVLAQCVCGKIKKLRGRTIKDNTSRNCGCKKGTKRRGIQKIPGTDSALTSLYFLYKKRAERKLMKFELSLVQFQNITSSNCYYCSAPPSNRIQKHKYIYYYNGIDRIDNSKGYEDNNVLPCCVICNTKKGAITKEMVYKLYELYARS